LKSVALGAYTRPENQPMASDDKKSGYCH